MLPYFQLGMDKKLIVRYSEYLKAVKPDFKYIGDNKDLIDLVECLHLPSANSVKVVGPRGSGVTMLLDALAFHKNDSFMPDEFMVRPLFKFNGDSLFSTSDGKVVEKRFQSALEELRALNGSSKLKPILVIDEGGNFAANAPQYVINSLMEAAITADYIDVIIGVDSKSLEKLDAKHPDFITSFTTKELKEPSPEKLAQILKFHTQKHAKEGVLIDEDAIEHIIAITERFKGMYETAQPNRAVRLMDAAATSFRIKAHSMPPGAYEKQKEMARLSALIGCGNVTGDELESMKSQLETHRLEMESATQEWDEHREQIVTLQDDIRGFLLLKDTSDQTIRDMDAETRKNNYDMIIKELKTLEDGHADFKGRAKSDVLNLDMDTLLDFAGFDLNFSRNPKIVEEQAKSDDYSRKIDKKRIELAELSGSLHKPTFMPVEVVDEVATGITKTPVGGISGQLKQNLMHGVELLQESVYGQDHVITPIVESLRRAAAGLNDPDRPLGAFLILGRPGTGKTFIGKQVAVKLFGSADYLEVLDMENYKEAHSISSLFGAPPGYAGYGKKGRLVEIGQNKPFCVLVLDEIEKAHYEVRQALLKVKGSGRLVGADGEEADFRNIIIIETSNYGQDIWLSNDFETGQKLILDEIRRDTAVFSPEYLDRNDEILCARELDLGSLQKIAAREVKEIAEKIVRRHPDLSLDVPVADINAFVAANCASVSGRRTEMIVNKAIATPLTTIALSGDKVKGRFSARFNTATNAFDTNFERASGIIMPKAAFADATPKLVIP